MKDPLQEYARNIADLQKIPLFNPRFREVYGWFGIFAILVTAACVFGLGLAWLAPWNPHYLPEEKGKIWLGVAVMPFAGLLVGSYLVEFLLKFGHVTLWAAQGRLILDWRAKTLGAVAVTLIIIGFVLSNAGQEFDLWFFVKSRGSTREVVKRGYAA